MPWTNEILKGFPNMTINNSHLERPKKVPDTVLNFRVMEAFQVTPKKLGFWEAFEVRREKFGETWRHSEVQSVAKEEE